MPRPSDHVIAHAALSVTKRALAQLMNMLRCAEYLKSDRVAEGRRPTVQSAPQRA
jgi:hypothetical protein